ncbi:uncharacterized protein LOC116342686 [Contarinia nasturtii]|uniref:uncharacterized protein LOC116342686 n=1 Tax=Contarinia nasturtii TaxID=265458 RepID=UPI0012D3A7D9|nr:uncharacterized protein LOC116342686 [Contarinia nasturtii]
MEIAEKFAYRTDQFIPFSLHRTTESELYCVSSRTKVYISELIYSHHCDERIFMEQSVLGDLTKFMPSRGVPKNAANIFNKSTKPEQDRLLVDYHLMTEELKVNGERVALAQTRWSPIQSHLSGKYYLAYLTNFGGCEIRQKHAGKFSWCLVVHNIAKEWLILRQKDIKYALNSFESFEDAVYGIKITAISWNQRLDVKECENLEFCFVTANGTIAFYNIGGETLELQFQKKLNCKQANAIEWFTFTDKNNRRRSYIVACEIKGVISLFSVRYEQIATKSTTTSTSIGSIADVIESAQLFSDSDGVCANGIQWEYYQQCNQLVFVICKGMHVFAYLFSLDKETVVSSCNHYVGHLTINGITKRKPLEYVVGTLSGHLECIRFKIDENTIAVNSEALKPPNGHSKYALYGVATSINNAFLLCAYFAGRPYDHLSLREPGHLTVCHQLGGQKSLETLQNSTTYNLSRAQDLAESIRCAQLRHDKIFENYLKTYPSEIECNEQYAYALKVRLLVTSARRTYLRQKNRIIECGNVNSEYNVLKKFILTLQSYSILLHLNKIAKKLNEFQIISAQCHRRSLYEFINLNVAKEYESIKVQFHPLIETLLTKSDGLDKRAIEKCAYCDAPVDGVKGVCELEHNLPRCCISMVQIPLMNQRQCIHCQSFALDDISKLKQILPSLKSIICPLCDLPLDQQHLNFFDYFE